MRRSAKRTSYHHGDLRAALVDTALELISEKGVQAFSLAEASRRLGVAPSAPYRHFTDREELLVAVGVRCCATLVASVEAEAVGADSPEERVAAIARGYVRFAGRHSRLFEVAFGPGAGRLQRPEPEEALRPARELLESSALALVDGDTTEAERLATAVTTTAHGHALLLRMGRFGEGSPATDTAVASVHRAAMALIAGRTALFEQAAH